MFNIISHVLNLFVYYAFIQIESVCISLLHSIAYYIHCKISKETVTMNCSHNNLQLGLIEFMVKTVIFLQGKHHPSIPVVFSLN